jgi:tetratricopeptide (TPR) repeat protein
MMLKRVAITALAGLAITASPAMGQVRYPALVADSVTKFQIAFCNLKTAGKVGDGQKALRAGLEDKDAAKRTASLEMALRTLQAEVAGTQAQSSGGWYYLARTYLALGDVAGADSAFARAQALAPDCEVDISSYRQNSWAFLATRGIEAQRNGMADSAMYYFRGASVMYQDLPHVFENMGVIFANAEFNDSAAVYFAKAAEVAKRDTSLVDNRNSATLNQAMVLQRSGRSAEAIPVLKEYLTWVPGDTDARKSLAYAFRQAGMADSADALEKAIVEEFSKMNLDSLPTQDLMAVGVSMFNSQQYDQASQVFSKLAARNPWSRDAVYNLANSYLALKQWDKLAETGKQLVAMEPLNEDSYRLMGQAYRELNQQDAVLKAAEALVSLPVNVEVTGFVMRPDGARFTATATGRSATDALGKALKPVPVNLVVEFVTEAGQVVASQDVSVPVLETGAAHEIRAEVKGAGIQGWRYKRK